nr:hypothetical protein [Tanacetum cinerariifolium]
MGSKEEAERAKKKGIILEKEQVKKQKSSKEAPESKTPIEEGRIVRNKMHKAFPLPGESSHWQYKFPLPVKGVPTARRIKIPLLGVCTSMMKKLPVKDRWQLH